MTLLFEAANVECVFETEGLGGACQGKWFPLLQTRMELPSLNCSTGGSCSLTLIACIFLVDSVCLSGGVAARCLLRLAFLDAFDLGVVRRFLISFRRCCILGGPEGNEFKMNGCQEKVEEALHARRSRHPQFTSNLLVVTKQEVQQRGQQALPDLN